MARPKKNAEVVEEQNESTIHPDILKDYDDVIFNAQTLIDEPEIIIPTTAAVDLGLSGGIPAGSWVIYNGPAKYGKAQPLTSIVMTPNGPVKMGDIKVGDKVSTPDGGISKVVGVYPQGKKKICRVVFNNNDYVDCCEDHLWYAKAIQQNKFKILSTKDILAEGVKYITKNVPYTKWVVPLPKYCHFRPKQVPMDPYLLGALIGNGSFTTYSLKFTTADQEMIDRIAEILDDDHHIYEVKSKKYDFVIGHKQHSKNKNKYKYCIKDLKLWGLKANNKFIPDIYKYNSVEVRKSILQGLMDTDGTVFNISGISYTSSSYRLALDVKEIFQSLGASCKIKQKYTKLNDKNFVCYVVYVMCDNPKDFFRLSRKKDKSISKKRKTHRTIQDIIYVGEEECQCIKIENENGLYLTDNFVITHNTSLALQTAANAQQLPELQEISKGGKVKVFYNDLEARLKNMQLSGVPGLDLDNFYPIRSSKTKKLTGEQQLDCIERCITNEPGCIIIVDSFSILSTETELTENIDKQQRADSNKLVAKFLRRMAQVLRINQVTCIGMTWNISNCSGYGASSLEKTPTALLYQHDVKLMAKKMEPWIIDNKRIGQTVDWLVKTSALGPPGMEVKSYLRYGKGFDRVAELVNIGTQLGLIIQSKGWNKLEFLRDTFGDELAEKNHNGTSRVCAFLEENPDYQDELYQQIKSLS